MLDSVSTRTRDVTCIKVDTPVAYPSETLRSYEPGAASTRQLSCVGDSHVVSTALPLRRQVKCLWLAKAPPLTMTFVATPAATIAGDGFISVRRRTYDRYIR